MHSIVSFIPRIRAEEAKQSGKPIHIDETGVRPERFIPETIEDDGTDGSYVMVGKGKSSHGSEQGEFRVRADAKRNVCTIESTRPRPTTTYAARRRIIYL